MRTDPNSSEQRVVSSEHPNSPKSEIENFKFQIPNSRA